MAGGIVSEGGYGNITECTNYGDISCKTTSGGGWSSGHPNCVAGGIAACAGGNIINCSNYGNITGTMSTPANPSCAAGGICGSQNSASGTISNSYNYAAIISSNVGKWTDQANGEWEVTPNANVARICGYSYSGYRLNNNYSIASTLVNGSIPIEDVGQNLRNGETITDTDTGDTEIGNSSVLFFSSWNPSTNQAFFDNSLLAYSVTENTDLSSVSSIDQLVGKYVLVEMDQTNVLEVASIRPVDSKIGVVRNIIAGNGNPAVTSLEFDDGVYAVVGGLTSYDGLIGETILYHLYSGEIYGFDVLEEKTGILEAWDSTTGQATIDGAVYPTNFLTDRSFLKSLEEYSGKSVTYFVCGDEAYKPLIRIDGIVETEKGIMVFSTEKSMTVQTGEFMWLAFGKSTDGGMLEGGWRQMAVVVSDPTVISLMEYEETEYGYQLEVYGKKQGATNVTITDTESGVSTSIVITVRDAYAETYSYAIDNMQTFYPNNGWEDHVQTNIYNLNGLYINNYQCRKTGNTYTVSFDAYNQRYHTGAVDIYDADGNWLKSEEITKMEMISSLWDTGEQVFYLISNYRDGKLSTYEAAAVSKHTKVSFEVPDGGYFTISNNYAESPGTFLFNSCDILFDGACDLIDAGVDGTKKSSFMKLIMGEFADNKAMRESFMKAFKDTAENQARSFAEKILKFELVDASSNITGQLENLFESLRLKWKDLFKIAADVGEGTILDKMGPAGLALKGCFEFSKGGSELTQIFNIAGSVDAPYVNVFSSIEEGYINPYGVIVNTNGNMDAEAVLQVFRISNDHTIEVILDGSGGDRPKDYELYNICFVKNDQLVQPSGKVSVRIPIPEGMDSDTCDVYRQEEDGNWTPLTAHIEGNYLVFETDHFSLYGVVGELSELKISSLPNQTQYSVGDIFNSDGLVLSLNGDLIDKGFICDPMILSEPGTQKITVRYGIASTEFAIAVEEELTPDSTSLPFTDVSTSAWYYGAISYVYKNNIMEGTGGTLFQPAMTTTRGMIVTMLHRMEGEPTAGNSRFTDVPYSQWYTNAVTWASENGIVEGYGNGRFGPNDTITREQMATILYRYTQYKGYDTTGGGSLSGYTDAGRISGWARTAMAWANANGLITGNTATTLNPGGFASRAEVATILMRFFNLDLEAAEPELPVQSYTIRYDANGGTGAPAAQVKSVQIPISLSSRQPTREGYNFMGWATSPGGMVQYAPGDLYGVDQDVTLYAVWEEVTISSPPEYFDCSVSITGTSNTSVNLYDQPGGSVEANYPLSSWDDITSERGARLADGSVWYQITIVDSDGYIRNLWLIYDSSKLVISQTETEVTELRYTVRYDANGGSGAPASQTKTEQEPLTLSSRQPTRTGYTFVGWATSSTGSVQYHPGDRYQQDRNITLYAVWVEDAPTVEPITPSIKMAVSQMNLVAGAGNSRSNYAVVTPAGQTVYWESSDTSIVTVSPRGENVVIKPVGPGTATITAYIIYNGNTYTASCTVVVERGQIALSESSLVLTPGVSTQLEETTGQEVSWSSSNPDVASVDAAGNITAVSPGYATIKASLSSDPSVTALCYVTVEASLTASIALTSYTPDESYKWIDGTDVAFLNKQSETEYTLYLDIDKTDTEIPATFSLDAVVNPERTDCVYTWESSNPRILFINGKGSSIRAILYSFGPHFGDATITLTVQDANGQTAEASITFHIRDISELA